jgi:hypothetical protein
MFVIGGVGVVADPNQAQKKALVCIFIEFWLLRWHLSDI